MQRNKFCFRKKNSFFFYKSAELESIVEGQKEQISVLQNISERVRYMSEHTDGNPFINVITSGWIWRFFNAQYWAKLVEEETKVLVSYQTKLLEVHFWQFMQYKVTPVIVVSVLLVGITGNGLLLTIFVRHKETRTLANSMLINLTVVDFVALVVNVCVDYLRVIMRWQLGMLLCKLLFFFSFLLIAISNYSVAMISVQRFVAVRQLSSLALFHQSQKTKYVFIAIVWGIGFILSVPHGVAPSSRKETCNAFSLGNASTIITVDLITLCVVPLLITAAFSGLTAYRIRRSAREIPGEATGHQQLKHSRMVSSTVLVALTVLFVVSYTPLFLYNFLNLVVHISVPFSENTLITIVLFYLRYVNSCLNPVVLFVLSKRYRRYIKRYCGQGEVQTATNSGSSTETSL